MMDSAGIEEKGAETGLLKDRGKRRLQICFRVTERAFERLVQVANLFEMETSDYAKAVLYKDLGVWTERIDYRRKRKGERRKESGSGL